MKYCYLLIVTVLLGVHADGQFKAGDRYLGGSASFGFTNDHIPSWGTNRSMAISFSPSFMKFRSDTRAIGFRLNTGYNAMRPGGNATPQSRLAGIGAGVFSMRVWPLGKGFFLAAESGVDVNYTRARTWNNVLPTHDSRTDLYNLSFSLSPSAGYQFTDRLLVGLHLNSFVALILGHQRTKWDSGPVTDDEVRNSIQLHSSLNNTTLGAMGVRFAFRLR